MVISDHGPLIESVVCADDRNEVVVAVRRLSKRSTSLTKTLLLGLESSQCINSRFAAALSFAGASFPAKPR
jgi:hypothetical protein